MPPHEDFELLRSSLKERTQREYKQALQQFTDYCKDRNLEVYNVEKLDEILNSYIHHVFRAPGRDGKGHANKVLCAVKLYLPEMKDKLHLSHRAMIGWAKVRPIQQKTPCPHDLALGYAYFLRIKGRFDMSCAVLLAFDSYLRHEDLRTLTKRRIIWSPQGATLILDQSKFGLNQSVTVRSKLVESLLKRLCDRVED